MLKLGFCITGSFCSMDHMLEILTQLQSLYDIEVFVSEHVNDFDTRFYSRDTLFEKVQAIIHKPIHTTIQEAETYGPMNPLDIVLLFPCSANTLAKIDLGLNDNAVTMVVKSSLRNNVPIVIGVFTNDLLSNSGIHFMSVLNKKNFYFVPLYQDDYKNKPYSMCCDFRYVKQTLECALNHKQIQPIMLGYKECV